MFRLVVAVFIAQHSVLGMPRNSIADNVATSQSPQPFSITNSMVDFTVDLSTNHLGRGNVVFSPFSITSVLNLLLLGASDRTYDQLRAALRYPAGIEDLLIHQQSGLQLQSLLFHSNGSTVSIANRLFAAAGLRMVPEFQKAASSFYQASVETLDFNHRPVPSQRRINTWVSDNTNGKIKKLLTEPLPTSTRLVATNVVYFNSSWQTPFNASRTAMDSRFHVSVNETVPANMMTGDLTVPYGVFRDRGFSVVGLPYSGGRHGMYVFLPNEAGEEALRRLEQHLGSASLTEIVNSLREDTLLVRLPRFKMSHTLSLAGALQKMGAADLFDPIHASLKRLSPDGPLFLSEVVHQAVIDVHETGTEAAAATVGLVSRGSFGSSFIANRPFLFVIRDTKTGVPLFWGRLVRPDTVE
ncbi:Serpin B11 [Amphibalanus amphitrite]|uniref:Serpin B11 n=1 Tax=Amphibalanus amphitrite TaxID=1232801 RepID=A0A6A4VH34_AMPAM|nr:Serpin B11 [Amphibalanus amphitrite]